MNEGEREALLRWLEASGLALELRVARTLRASGIGVVDPFFYQDVTTDEGREGDVAAWATPLDSGEPPLIVVFECKHSGKAEQQWVGVRPSARALKPLSASWQWVSWSGGSDYCSEQHDEQMVGLVIRRGLVTERQTPCTRILTANTKDSHNPAWNACRQALSATYGLAKSYLLEELPTGSRARGAALAVVVTTSRLRLCELDDQGELQLTETDQLEVLCESPDGQRRLVIVMNEGRVAELGAQLFGSDS